ncbi:hypothetical protein [Luteolibacter sp. Populi]|uniref:hypothetical protein n=1 Tax=Luteolibacter sp. Populi TaxID=3230487 RepID=UPI00346611F2
MRFPAAIVMLLACGLASAAQSPSDAALAWLRDVASGKAEMEPGAGTALSPDVDDEDLKSIRSRLSRLRESLKPDDLRPLADKEDGDLAAVLVSQITNFDSESVQIHAVGLVKRGEQWLPAPLPSSFNATGLSFRPGFLARAKVLEEWMLEERSKQFFRLKEDAFSLLADEMRKFITPDALLGSTPAKLAEDFLAALAKRDLPAALALLGGLENPPPEHWDETLQVVSANLRKKEITHPLWRLLAAPEAVRTIVAVEEDGEAPMISIVGLDPAADPGTRPLPNALHLTFVRSKSGSWHIRLPHELLAPATQPLAPGQEDAARTQDAEFIEKFPLKLMEQQAPAPSATAEEATAAILEALNRPSLAELCTHLDLEATPATALDSMSRAAELWQKVHAKKNPVAPVLLELQEAGDDACALIQMFSGRSPAESAVETIFLQRKPSGWLANPGFSGVSALPYPKDSEAFMQWLPATLKARNAEWWDGLLTRIGGVAADSAPSEEEARRVVAESRQAFAKGDVAGALARAACFDDKTGVTRLLRNTGSDFLARQAGEVLSVHRAGRWAAVSLRVPPPLGDDSANSYPLVLVVSTPAGPRILPELDLYDPLTDNRNFFNRVVWDRITARLPDGARSELEPIYEKHRTISAADRGRQKPTE